MKKTILAISLLFSGVALAGPDCTKELEEKWLNQEKFQEDLKAKGYKIKKFKITDGKCFEIYGWDKEGKKVEIYFNPVSGEVLKEKVK